MFYTYVLRSKVDGKLYVGCTDNLRKRLIEQNSGRVIATKYRVPLDLVYFEGCLDKIKAFKRERYFKTGYGRRFLVSRM